jgi:hypothetical protein
MAEAADQPHAVELAGLFLEAADQEHGAVGFEQLLLIHRRFGFFGSFRRFVLSSGHAKLHRERGHK